MIFSFLNKPFPRADVATRSVKNTFFVGCFVAFFLIVFEPFQINEWQTNNKTLKLIGFGIISFVVPLCIQFVIRLLVSKKHLEDRWTVGKEILSILTVIIFIAIANLLYGNLLHAMPLNLKGFLFALSSVIMIGVFPVTIHVMRKHNKLLKINFEQAVIVNEHLHHDEIKTEDPTKKISVLGEEPLPNDPSQVREEIKHPQKLMFIAENEKDKLELNAEQLLYIESADNYSNFIFLEEGKIKKQLIRSSLKRIETQVNVDFVIRCHRTFIVNLKNVTNIEGNAAGYKLTFDGAEYQVPVSRNYGTLVVEKLKTIK